MEPDITDHIYAVKMLNIPSGRILSAQHHTLPTLSLSEEMVLENLPPRTIVKVVLTPASGSYINVEVWLPNPENWNGRFVGLGNGGSAGGVPIGGLANHCSKGCAAVTTDMGTAPSADIGIGTPEVWKDFGFRATHLMTVTAKQIIAAFYGKPPDHSYFLGGSTGGQQALQEAQRYPEDYDGIVAMVPAHCRTPLHAYFLWNYQILQKCPFTEEQEQCVIAAANEYMATREIPLLAGRMVSDPRCTAEDIEAVANLALEQDPTLTDKHADALRKLFSGPVSADTGERVFGGLPLGSTFNNAAGHLYLFRWVFGTDKDFMDIDFSQDIDTYTKSLGPYLNAENPDLTSFKQSGGKLIMASGSADSIVPYHATLDYYEQVIEFFGSMEQVQAFFRFYMLPGRDHGAGGPGINKLEDTFDLIVKWREEGIAPESIEAQRVVEENVEFTLPIYPYPLQTGLGAGGEFAPIAGARGGVDRVAERFRPAAAD